MDDELYHMEAVERALWKLNPHLELKEYRKNPSDFTVDFILNLAECRTKVEVPMDLFRDYDRGGREEVEDRLALYGDLIRFASTYGSWELPVDRVCVIGEATHQNGPFADDWFLCLLC